MKTKILLLFCLLTCNKLYADIRDSLVGTYIYNAVRTTYFPPPPVNFYFNGIFYITKSISDSTQIIFTDSLSGNSMNYTATSDSSFSYIALPWEQSYGIAYPNDSMIINIYYYTAGLGIFISVTYNSIKKSSTTVIYEAMANKQFSITPNPASEKLTITTIHNYNNLKTELFNIFGDIILTKEYQNISSTIELDISKIKNGIYFLRLSDDDSFKIFKIIKQ